MNDETNNEFLQQLSASYGQMESVLGQEGYVEFIRARQAERLQLIARAELSQSISAVIRIATLIGILMAMPVLVWLWRWAI